MTCHDMSTRAQGWAPRWITFNAVGSMGFGLQLLTLMALTDWAHVHYLVSTAIAVEVAVLHNFVWHERWTWSDRAART